MPTFRITKKLAAALKIDLDGAVGAHPLDHEWFADLFMVGRTKCLIWTHRTTLLTFVLPRVTAAQLRRFSDVFQQELRGTLNALAFPDSLLPQLGADAPDDFMRTNDRGVMGSMLDHRHMFEHMAASSRGFADVVSFNVQLNRSPMSFLKADHSAIHANAKRLGLPRPLHAADVADDVKLAQTNTNAIPIDGAFCHVMDIHRWAPLRLQRVGDWDPSTEHWCDDGEPIPQWARPIIARGKRPMFEMEQVSFGVEPDDHIDNDPILQAIDLYETGHKQEAQTMLLNMVTEDPRRIDAYAHLGNFALDHFTQDAARYYAFGMSMGVHALGRDFNGVLPWGLIDNRPFLRCMDGLAHALWSLGHRRDAEATFRKLLWLNPTDNQGARFAIDALRAGKTLQQHAAAQDDLH